MSRVRDPTDLEEAIVPEGSVSLIVPRVPGGFKVEELLLLNLAPREGTSQSLLV